jgi:hypothetical protein
MKHSRGRRILLMGHRLLTTGHRYLYQDRLTIVCALAYAGVVEKFIGRR